MLSCGIVILNYNTADTTVELYQRIIKENIFDKIVIIDNASTDNSVDIIEKIVIQNEDVLFVKLNENTGYAKGNNVGLRILCEKMLVDICYICNPDVFFEKELIYEMQKLYEKYLDYGVITSIRTDEFNKNTIRQYWEIPTFKTELMHCFYIGQKLNKMRDIMTIDDNNKKKVLHEIPLSPGAFFSIRSSLAKTIGYLDSNTFLYYEESCLAVKVKFYGYKIGIYSGRNYYTYRNRSSTQNMKNTEFVSSCQMDSREYFLKKYLCINRIKRIVFSLLKKYSRFETMMLLFIKRLLVKLKYLGD